MTIKIFCEGCASIFTYHADDRKLFACCPHCDYADYVKIKKIGENAEILILSILPEIRRRYDTQA